MTNIEIYTAMGMSMDDAVKKYNDETQAKKEFNNIIIKKSSKKDIDINDDIFGTFYGVWLA